MSLQFTVACRILETNERPIVTIMNNNKIVLNEPDLDKREPYRSNRQKSRIFNFDYIFYNKSQEEVYRRTTKNMLKDVVAGFNCTIFSYGSTGSGKTYTMLGEQGNHGIVWRALEELTNYLNSQLDNSKNNLTISMFELYNENIRDLLGDSEDFLDVREDKDGQTVIVNLAEYSVTCMNDVKIILNTAIQKRSCEPTWANHESSRSHAIIKIIFRRVVSEGENKYSIGRLYLIDLAGAERASKTRNIGKRFVEESNINFSLLALKNCIDRLANGKLNFINYRDSKLTRVLKECLNGTSKTTMIAHVINSRRNFYESANTLYYAQKTMGIKTLNQQPNVYAETSLEIISRLKKELKKAQKIIQERPHHTKILDDVSQNIRQLVIRQNQLLQDNRVEIPTDVAEMYQKFLKTIKTEVTPSPMSQITLAGATEAEEYRKMIPSEIRTKKLNLEKNGIKKKLPSTPSSLKRNYDFTKPEILSFKNSQSKNEILDWEKRKRTQKLGYMVAYQRKINQMDSPKIPPLSITGKNTKKL